MCFCMCIYLFCLEIMRLRECLGYVPGAGGLAGDQWRILSSTWIGLCESVCTAVAAPKPTEGSRTMET